MRAVLAPVVCLTALFLGAYANAQGDAPQPPPSNQAKEQAQERAKPTAAQQKIARAIAHGHAYDKHVVDEELFPEVKSKDDFATLIGQVIAQPTHHRKLENGREAYSDQKSNTIVIYNPRARDRGTCFRPRAGLKYFQGLQ